MKYFFSALVLLCLAPIFLYGADNDCALALYDVLEMIDQSPEEKDRLVTLLRGQLEKEEISPFFSSESEKRHTALRLLTAIRESLHAKRDDACHEKWATEEQNERSNKICKCGAGVLIVNMVTTLLANNIVQIWTPCDDSPAMSGSES